MFDELHDPSPPRGDSSRLADVAERAAAMRRRRRAVLATISAVALIAAGSIAIAVLSDDDPSTLRTADTSVPTSEAEPGRSTDSTAPPRSEPSPTTTEPVVAPPTTLDPPPTILDPPPTTVPSAAIVGDPVPLDCGGFRVCTYDHLTDGRLVQLGNDGGESGPPTYTIYDETATTVMATGWLGNDDAVGAFLVDVGPSDIAYVWYTVRDEVETAHFGAFELTGPEAGRQIPGVDATVDFSGDTEQVPTRDGFVEVGCCAADPVRPAPNADVILPWVDRDGNPITNDDDTFFSIAFSDQTLSITSRRNGMTMVWDRPDRESAPRGMPRLHQLDDGRIVHLFDGLHSAGSTTVPVYLNPDGSIGVGASPGAIEHILPDGRAVVRAGDDGDAVLVELAAPTPEYGVPGEVPTETLATTTTSLLESTEPVASPDPDPLVAITADGDAVYFPDGVDGDPVLVLDGPPGPGGEGVGDGPNGPDRVAYSAAFDELVVGVCCSPIVGTIRAEPAAELPIEGRLDAADIEDAGFAGYGYAPALDSTGARITLIGPEASIAVGEPATGLQLSLNLPEEAGDAWDIVWLDDETIGVLGVRENAWTLTMVRMALGDLEVASSRPFASTSDFGDLRFAGEAIDGQIAVHDAGTDAVLTGTVDDFGNNNGTESGSSLRVIRLPGPTRSAWYAGPDQLIRVDADGTLVVDDAVIPGTYLWAAR